MITAIWFLTVQDMSMDMRFILTSIHMTDIATSIRTAMRQDMNMITVMSMDTVMDMRGTAMSIIATAASVLQRTNVRMKL